MWWKTKTSAGNWTLSSARRRRGWSTSGSTRSTSAPVRCRWSLCGVGRSGNWPARCARRPARRGHTILPHIPQRRRRRRPQRRHRWERFRAHTRSRTTNQNSLWRKRTRTRTRSRPRAPRATCTGSRSTGEPGTKRNHLYSYLTRTTLNAITQYWTLSYGLTYDLRPHSLLP